MDVNYTDAEFRSYHHGDKERSRQVWQSHRKEVKMRAKERRKILRWENRPPFVAWDGEGYTDAETGEHRYFLLANSLGEHIVADEGRTLSRTRCFDFILKTARANPNCYHVIFGGNYDFNMMLKGEALIPELASTLYREGKAWIDGYAIQFQPGRRLHVRRPGDKGTTLYDVFPFFQTSFIKAAASYLGENYPHRTLIETNKALRGQFRVEQLPTILEYCQAELEVLVLLMDELRERLHAVDIDITKWYGPGAIAAYLYGQQSMKAKQDQTYHERKPELASAARFAYAGGRFELIRFGHVEQPVYEYDINSAYPYAMTKLPNLQNGRWHYVDGDPGYIGPDDFAVLHLDFTGVNSERQATEPTARDMARDSNLPSLENPWPLWRRFKNGSIAYPHAGVVGWYWTPEYLVARQFAERFNLSLRVLGAWVYTAYSDERPFAFVPEMYERRAELKKVGNGAHVGIKLGLNSLYGKLAQQVGWREGKLPPFHQLEWAGYITSHCRAQIFSAAMQNLGSVVAFETDALFVTEKLDLHVGTGLGEWEQTNFKNLTYMQSGIYYGELEDGKQVVKTRGFKPSQLARSQALEILASDGGDTIVVPNTTFITVGAALNTKFDKWCRWIPSEKEIYLKPELVTLKRTHIPGCRACERTEYGPRFTLGRLHNTVVVSGFEKGHSCEFPVEWINPDPAMTELSESREQAYELDE